VLFRVFIHHSAYRSACRALLESGPQQLALATASAENGNEVLFLGVELCVDHILWILGCIDSGHRLKKYSSVIPAIKSLTISALR
jgi:hypothetical protein